MRVAHVSTFPPIKCGIASFAADLISAIPDVDHVTYSLHYGAAGETGSCASANVNSPQSLIALAKAISNSDCDVVSLQHEFGIWGGKEGENIFCFLDNLRKPIVSVLHTTFGPGIRGAVQREIVDFLIDRSVRVVLLTEMARRTTEELLARRIEKIVVIPHGVPDFPYVSPSALWEDGRRTGSLTCRLISPGFFREDKGLEQVLCALCELQMRGHKVEYVIAGEAQGQFPGQKNYRERIEALVDSHGMGSVVRFDGRYLSLKEQVAAIQGCHLGVFAYQCRYQSSSGTIPLVLSLGRPVLCTPFEYAQAKANEGFAVSLAAGFDHLAIADAIEKFKSREGYLDLARATYDRTREWTWSRVGAAFAAEYRRAQAESRASIVKDGN
jgi:glycosyltransferase involved in cell wall biosynthesis